MGRVWDFLNQDANQAMDRLGEPYVRFAQRNRLLMVIANVAWFAFAWVVFGRTAALLIAALVAVLVGVTLALMVGYVLVVRRRASR